MKNKMLKNASIILCLSMLLSINAGAINSDVGTDIVKGLYDALNVVVEGLVSTICRIYPDPVSWKNIDEYNSDEVYFMNGRNAYLTEENDNFWSLGYSSRSLIPKDFESGKYNIGRDLTNKPAEGIYDDQRIRVAVIDDNSGEGAVVLGSIDSLGVTSTDVREIRRQVIDYCRNENIQVASINIFATHAHSALDTQGVSTGFANKLIGAFWYNLFGSSSPVAGLENAQAFRDYFISESVQAVKDAFSKVETGKMFYSTVDSSLVVKDKRELISKEDLPEIAVLRFIPDSGNGDTYICDITCHATSFSAGHNLVGSDFIYYMDEYLKNEANANLVMVAGAVGQVSREISVDTQGMTEWEEKGAQAKALGTKFADFVLNADYSTQLKPVLNVIHKEVFISPENSILVLACEIGLVNNKVYYDGFLFKDYMLASEIGYIEFGNKVGFSMFPGELYPEVFWGDEITGFANWDGTQWQYDSLADSVQGVDVYPISLANDAIGYVLTDNNFAFMGHIIGDGIADEVLSVGKHIGSFLVSEYLSMVNSLN